MIAIQPRALQFKWQKKRLNWEAIFFNKKRRIIKKNELSLLALHDPRSIDTLLVDQSVCFDSFSLKKCQ